MSPRRLASVAAIFSLVSGGVGLIAPAPLASAFEITLDPMAVTLVRLACAAYLGYGALNWLARDVTDGGALRAIATGNLVAWGIGAVVSVAAFASGVGAWPLVVAAIQVAFSLLWGSALLDRPGVDSPAAAIRR